jgi:hypothetical protein
MPEFCLRKTHLIASRSCAPDMDMCGSSSKQSMRLAVHPHTTSVPPEVRLHNPAPRYRRLCIAICTILWLLRGHQGCGVGSGQCAAARCCAPAACRMRSWTEMTLQFRLSL